MGTIYLVRHGQASFGAADYDQLSDLGISQCERLGQYWRVRQPALSFDAVFTGTLRRQQQTWQAIARGAGLNENHTQLPSLNEFNGAAIVRAVQNIDTLNVNTREGYQQYFQLLRTGLIGWMEGRLAPEGMPPWVEFAKAIMGVLDRVRATYPQGNTLIVSSGGPISIMVGQILGASVLSTIDLNLTVRNSSVTELICTPKRCMLLTFNTLPHLDEVAHTNWITYT
jgi:broad specificity phosphatase PhoE